MTEKRVLSIGQCGADHYALTRTLRNDFAAEVVSARTAQEALDTLRCDSFALVLVNRIFDTDGFSGLDLIRQLQDDQELRSVPVMLVSNHADAQSQAVALGALPGFGKAVLGRQEVRDRLKGVLGE